MYYLGVDVGSVSVKIVLLNEKNELLYKKYTRSKGLPLDVIREVMAEVAKKFPLKDIRSGAATGAGGKLIASLLGLKFVNEIEAQNRSTAMYHPEVRTVIEIGGEDSKLILMGADESKNGSSKMRDFAMNTVCAAGTGSFLDQQAVRLGVNIVDEFAALAMKSKNPPRIAGRCSVFAKSDMIHLQQVATPDYDIIAGLCFAMARNYKSNIAKGKKIEKPIAFQGGVAANLGMRWAFEEILGLEKGELIIPEHFNVMGAIGAVLSLLENDESKKFPFKGMDKFEKYMKERTLEHSTMPKLPNNEYTVVREVFPINGSSKIDAFLGIDVGSISTNVVVVDKDINVLAREYLMTAGRPIEAVRHAFSKIEKQIGDKVRIRGAATTGSGRYLTGDFVGADVVKNEITAHATGASFFDIDVDTIFEIGGQDAKYIRMENGAVIDFAMNKVCAAGTGSFLEEQAEKLGISVFEFGDVALSSKEPAALGERCTVFMEADVNLKQQQGVKRDDLIGGLSYSIVANYLNRVVEGRSIGKRIFFQGGPAANKGIKAAFEQVLGKKIIVPPHHDVMGAIGCAILARNSWDGKTQSKFKGFDLSRRQYEISSFDCKACSNMCEIHRVTIEGEKPLHYGSRCGKFDDEKKVKLGEKLPRLFEERREALWNSYPKTKPDKPNGKTVGIPQVALFFELFPLWKAFFTELGFEVVPSDDTNKNLVHKGLEYITAETCYPIKVAHGHVLNLIEKNVDYMFIPSVVNMPSSCPEMESTYCCPYVQSIPYLIESAFDIPKHIKVLKPVIHMQRGQTYLEKLLVDIGTSLKCKRPSVKKAIEIANAAQEKYYKTISERGNEVLANLKEDQIALVIVSRPYNGCDKGMNLNIPDKLRDLGVLAIPMDFLPLASVDISPEWPHMYWKYGQRILAAANIIRNDHRLNAIYYTNFGCGPDSFISKFFSKELDFHPYLTLEVDEHSADAGAVTRCEAFIDSLKNIRKGTVKKDLRVHHPPISAAKEKRTVYIPYMDDHNQIIAAALRAHGVDAIPLPPADDETLTIGRKYTSGKECYPCIITTGDILKKCFSKDFDPSKSAFFMPSAMGPCRFGQYNRFHRMVLDELGFKDVPMVILDQGRNFHDNTYELGAGFNKLTWNAILAVDTIGKALWESRPYEKNKGEADSVYEKCLADIVKTVETKGDLVKTLRKCRKAFEALPVDKSEPKPKIGVIGEIYVRMVEYANENTIRRIEALGGEVVMPPLEEWVRYITWERLQESKSRKDLTAIFKNKMIEKVQNINARSLRKPFNGMLSTFPEEADTAEVIELGNKYVHDSLRGEAILSMGRAVEYAERDFSGVVNIVPFNCLPGTIVTALLKRFQENHDGMPVLDLSFDGTPEAGKQTRLEAFMYQAHQFRDRVQV